jgi:hypothetical protein
MVKQDVKDLLKIDIAPAKQVIACIAPGHDTNELRRCICQSQRIARGSTSCINNQPQPAGARMFRAPIENVLAVPG